MATAKAVQINARMDAELKERGDAVLASFGRSATDAIRSLWTYMATMRQLPPFMVDEGASDSLERAGRLAAKGAGMAMQMAGEAGLPTSLQAMTYEQLREAAFEESLAEGRFDYA